VLDKHYCAGLGTAKHRLIELQTALVCHMFPGKVFGSELRARKHE
jgi:hypothetical protein